MVSSGGIAERSAIGQEVYPRLCIHKPLDNRQEDRQTERVSLDQPNLPQQTSSTEPGGLFPPFGIVSTSGDWLLAG